MSLSFLYKAPFFSVLLLYVAGLLLPPHSIAFLFWAALFLGICLAFFCKGRRSPWFFVVALFLSFCVGQMIQARPKLPIDPSHIYYFCKRPLKVELDGLVVSSPERFEEKSRVFVEAERLFEQREWSEASGLIRVDLYGPAPELEYGDRVRFNRIKCRRPGNFRNPGGFDYTRYLRIRGINALGWAGNKDRVTILERGQGGLLMGFAHGIRKSMLEFADNALPGREGAVLKGLVFGRKGGLSREDSDLFYETGVAHLMAVSGLHVGFVAFASYFLLEWVLIRLLFRFYRKGALGGWSIRLAAVGTILPVLFYALIVGDRVSSIRAAIMAVLFLLSIAVKRGLFLYHTLAVSALVILVWKPESIYEAGFQLSFCAVFFIIFLFSRWLSFTDEAYSDLTSTRFEEFVIKNRRLSGYLFVTLFAFIGVFPLIAYHFNRVSLFSLALNLLAVPLATVIVTTGLFLSFLYMFLPSVAGFLAPFPGTAVSALLSVTELFHTIPYHSIRVPTPSPGLVIAFYSGVIGISLFKADLKKLTFFLLPCLLLIPALPGIGSKYKGEGMAVTFLDVGQGESAFIRLPSGKTMLVDGGRLFGRMDAGRWVVGPFLWDMGVRKLDYMIASHSDSDHVGGLGFILKEFRVGTILENGGSKRNKAMIKIREKAASLGIPVRVMAAGEIVDLSGAAMEVFNPGMARGADKKQLSDNNRSLVFRLECGDISILLTGDIETEAEATLISSGYELRSTIMKVPHHGSDTSSSSEFVRAVDPDAAIISAGEYNPFGHPDPEVVERYKRLGVKVYQTGKCGAVTVFTDCKTYSIKTEADCGMN